MRFTGSPTAGIESVERSIGEAIGKFPLRLLGGFVAAAFPLLGAGKDGHRGHLANYSCQLKASAAAALAITESGRKLNGAA